ncbi:MAG: stage II sporulation protein E, partial [Clostridiales bacterium]|nr:stage II sporulation protein E [Clostridiales bacterium]
MTTKEKLTTGAARAREELEQKGRLMLRAPLLLGGAECAIRFLLGAVLSGAQIFGSYAPFAVALVGASGSGLGGFSALLGAVLGYLVFWGPLEGLRYIAAAILAFSVSFALFDIRLYRKGWFMPVVTALLTGATGFVYLSESGWRTADVIFFLTEVFFTGITVYFYRLSFARWREEPEGSDLRRLVSLLILGGTVLLALAQVALPGGLSLGRAAAALGVMLLAYRNGFGLGSAVGISAGLAMDLAAGGGPYYSMVYAVAGLVTGIFQAQGKLLAAIAYVLTNAVAVLWTWESGVRISLLYEVFLASVCFLLLPEAVFRWAGTLFLREERTETVSRASAYV